MFKKTRLRIFALIMIVVTVMIILMLSIIYIANGRYNYERGISLLEHYMENNAEGPHPEPDLAPEEFPDRHPEHKGKHDKMFNLSTFYSVFYDSEGTVTRIECDGGRLYTEQEIQEITDRILESGKSQGSYESMPYLVKTSELGTIVAVLDNTMEVDNSGRLFEYSLIAGISGWAILLILAWFFTKRIVDPLEQNDIKQKQFISDAGHELKTPISVISANAELLSVEIGDNKWLSNIQYENERMGNLVKQLLELVRAENMQQTKEPLDLSRLVSGGALPFESVAFENDQILTMDIEAGIRVVGNSNQLSQLTAILIDNAIQHGTHGKEVKVALHSVKHQAVLSVINAGEPIPEGTCERLFERFYRIDEVRNEASGHYGLGLAIAKAIVTAHGGRIEPSCYDGLIEFKVTIPKES